MSYSAQASLPQIRKTYIYHVYPNKPHTTKGKMNPTIFVVNGEGLAIEGKGDKERKKKK